MAVPHFRQRRAHFRPPRQMARALVKSPYLHQRADRDIERALTLAAILQTRREQLEQLRRHLDRPLGRMAIDLTPLALRPVVRKHPVETPDFFKGIFGRRFQPAAILAIQDQGIRRTHGLDGGLQPQLLGLGGQRRKNRQQKQNYHNLFHLEGDFSS